MPVRAHYITVRMKAVADSLIRFNVFNVLQGQLDTRRYCDGYAVIVATVDDLPQNGRDTYLPLGAAIPITRLVARLVTGFVVLANPV